MHLVLTVIMLGVTFPRSDMNRKKLQLLKFSEYDKSFVEVE